MWWTRAVRRCSVVAGVVVFAWTPPVLAGSTATELIAAFHSSVVDVMKAGNDLNLEGRYERLMPRVRSTFNVPFMMRVATDPKWREATEAERAKLVDAYIRVSICTYASHIGSYGGEQFEIVGEQGSQTPYHFVFARVVRASGDSIPLSYVMRKFGDDWRVVDIVVAGAISEVALRRSEYGRIVNQDGVAKLAAQLNELADRILARSSRPVASSN